MEYAHFAQILPISPPFRPKHAHFAPFRQKVPISYFSSTLYISSYDTGYPHDGRADKDSYPHDGRVDKDSYPHDRRADKDSYPHDRHNQYIIGYIILT